MTGSPPESRASPWWRRKWVTLGEVIGVGALAIAALTFLDARRLHREEQAERRVAAQHVAESHALVLRAEAVDNGERLMLRPLRDAQAVQSQRYVFPRAVLDHAMQVDAAPPQLQVAWVREGLRGQLRDAARARGAKPVGTGRLPVAVLTTYVEDGETRTDRSLYLIGYKTTSGGLFGGSPRIFFQGLELLQRGAGGDLQARLDTRWASEPKF